MTNQRTPIFVTCAIRTTKSFFQIVFPVATITVLSCNKLVVDQFVMAEPMDIDSSEEEEEEFFELVASQSSLVSLLTSHQALQFVGGFQPGWKLGSSVIKREGVPVEELFGRLDDRSIRPSTLCA